MLFRSKNQESLTEAYKKEFGESVDITDDTDRKNRIDSLKADVEQWKKDLEAENSPLTDADKEALKEKIVKAESELSYLEGYDTNKKALEESNARITELNSADYLNVDADGKAGTPGAKLTQEADDYVQGKIDQALAELAY